MTDLTLTQAFAKYGAKIRNPRNVYSAIAEDGSLVISCWFHYFSRPEDEDVALRYSDRLSRMRGKGGKLPGKNLLKEHLEQAFREELVVRPVIATTPETDVVDAGQDSSSLPKTFHLKETHIGKVVVFDGDAFRIDFTRKEE